MFIFGIFNGQLVVQLLQAIALSALPILWFRFSTYFIDKHIIALLSSIWLSIYPELLGISAFMYTESILLFLLFLAFLMLMRWRESTTYLKGIMLGTVISLVILTNSRMALFVGISLLYFFFVDWKERRKFIPHYLVTSICIVCLVGVWITRNVIELNAPLLNSRQGENLFWGHNINANGTSKYFVGDSRITKIKLKTKPVPKKMDIDYPRSPELASIIRNNKSEADNNRVYQKEAYNFIINHPEKELDLFIKKLWYSWWRSPTHVVTFQPVYIIPWSITLFFFVIGLIISLSRWKQYFLFYLMFFSSTVTQIIYHANPRFRLPIYPFIFGIAAIGFVYIIELLVSRNILWQKKYSDFTSYLLR
jgi:hypothetical protein